MLTDSEREGINRVTDRNHIREQINGLEVVIAQSKRIKNLDLSVAALEEIRDAWAARLAELEGKGSKQ